MPQPIVTFYLKDKYLICAFHGRMDSQRSEQSENDVFDRILREKLPVKFDLNDTSYVSSAFLRLCVKCARAVQNAKIHLVNLDPQIKDIFRMTGLERLFDLSLKPGSDGEGSAERLDELNANFSVENQLRFARGPGGLLIAIIDNAYCHAEISLYGGHVLRYQSNSGKPVLWVSDHAIYERGKAIRGGIPVCWPWFGASATHKNHPSHGFARIEEWDVTGASALDDGATRLELTLVDNDNTRALWPNPFALSATITAGNALRVDLTAKNTGDNLIVCGAALHSYFAVDDIAKASVSGLEGREYLDALDSTWSKQDGPIRFTEETDRVYADTPDTCVIEDTGYKRKIRIDKAGSVSTVVWNPWIDKSQRMKDFGDDEYQRMLCVETCNAGKDQIRIAPGQSHRLTAIISEEPLA